MTTVLKLGGSILTTPKPNVDHDTLDRLASEIAATSERLILVHGAGHYGHPLAHEHDLAQGIQGQDARSATAHVHAHVRRLNLMILDALNTAGLSAMTLSPLGMLSTNDGTPGGWNLVPLHRLLENDLLPVLHGDLVLDTTRGLTVLSGDTIAAEASRFLDAEHLIFALDQDGVYTHPPETGDAHMLETPTIDEIQEARENATTGSDPDVTGGMQGKLDAALHATKRGARVSFVNGLEPNRVRDAINGDTDGTTLTPRGTP